MASPGALVLRKAMPSSVAVATLVALFVSRTGLVLHEFLGHGATAMLIGGHVTGHRLFVFGGGRVSYAYPSVVPVPSRLFVSMGGIAVETIAGIAVLAAFATIPRLRRASAFTRFVATTLAWSFLVHAGFYLVEGTHYGYGDGRLLHALLGGARPWFVALGTCAVCVVMFAAGRALGRFVASWLGAEGRAPRFLLAATMAAVAGGVHLGLTNVERALTSDEPYARAFRDEPTDVAYREARRELEERRKRGDAEPSDEERARLLNEAVSRNPPFPLRPLLIALLVASAILGVLAPRATLDTEPKPLDARAVRAAAIATGVVMVVVVLLRG